MAQCRRLGLSLFLLVLAMVAHMGGCGFPDYSGFDASAGPDAGLSDGSIKPTDSGGMTTMRPTCSSDADCAMLTATKVCDTAAGICVECIPGTEATAHRCGQGLYCGADERCSVGCASDADCKTDQTCDAATHQCTNCTTDADCAIGTMCQGQVCMPKCSEDSGCPAGWHCCSNTCSNFLTDSAHCTSCGHGCASNEECINGSCIAGCPHGYEDCDRSAANGCETNINSDPKNCGGCAIACSSGFCSGGQCASVECDAGFADCDKNPDNKCEVNISADADNCGQCGKKCSTTNGTATCTASTCNIVCNSGFADCDKNPDTGCEIDTSSDMENCGSCGSGCTNDNGTTRCTAGACTPTCAAGFDSCDGNPQNGCETNIGTSLMNCGACNKVCALKHATATCDIGVCKVTSCDPGFADCDGNPENGCEADLTSPDTCGRCDNKCNSNGGVASCTVDADGGGTCSITCSPGRADCANGPADGCEVDTNVSVAHCGSCTNRCTVTGGTPACVDGGCTISNCQAGLADCNGQGCVTNINTDANNCGGCGNQCYYPNAVGKCTTPGGAAPTCVLDHCTDGYGDCTSAIGCETKLGTVTNCAGCGLGCTNAHGSTTCMLGATSDQNICKPVCAIGFGDCDGNPANGCETPLNTTANCGACGVPCARSNATTSCSSGTCEVTGCSSGFDDCNNEAVSMDGCETSLKTNTDCGGCGVTCSLPNASTSCSTGTCQLGLCSNGFGDCTAGAGCETNLNTDKKHCGGCTVDCTVTIPNNNVSCMTGTCTAGSCVTGFADCTSAAGCETQLGTNSNCSKCGEVCQSNHTTSNDCSTAMPFVCQPVCAAGFMNCNSDPTDGCETDISKPAKCGSCTATPCAAAMPVCTNSGGTFACAAPPPVVVVNSTTGSTTTPAGTVTLTMSHALATASGNHRMVVVGVIGEGNAPNGKPSNVTYNGVSMTLAASAQSGNQAWAGVYYLPDASLPANTTPASYPIVVSPGASPSGTFAFIANVLELKGVDQTTPIDAITTTGITGSSCSPSKPGSSITPITGNAFLYGALGLFNTGALADAGIAGSPQLTTTLQALLNGGSGPIAGIAGYLSPASAGVATAVTWNVTSCAAWAHALVAIRPAIN